MSEKLEELKWTSLVWDAGRTELDWSGVLEEPNWTGLRGWFAWMNGLD